MSIEWEKQEDLQNGSVHANLTAIALLSDDLISLN